MLKSHSSLAGVASATAVAGFVATALAVDIEVIYTEIASHSSGTVPGALDAAGQPVATNWLALEDFALRPDGGLWVLKGRTTQATTNDSILVMGSGLSGTMFAQDGQPLQGGVAGELYDFFDTPVPAAWNDNNGMVFGCRAKGGVSGVAEKIITYIGGVHTVVLTHGTPATGLLDIPANPTGDELFGNSMNSIRLLNTGQPFFVNTPITNCSSFRYPAVFIGNASFRQSGVSMIDFETWDSFDLDSASITPDGAHWIAIGDTENPNTAIDAILAVDDVKIAQESTEIGDTGIIVGTVAPFFAGRMLPDGTWFARGDDTSDNDWAMVNGKIIAKTGDPITSAPGPTENWGNALSALTGNTVGDWLLAGNTNNADVNADNVLVLNGETVLAREGDPIDLNGNGKFDDNVFINGFQPNDLFLTDDGILYLLVTLRDGAAVALGDALLRTDIDPEPVCPPDINGDTVVNVDDLLEVINGWGTPGSSDVDGNGTTNVDDLLAVINGWGDCP